MLYNTTAKREWVETRTAAIVLFNDKKDKGMSRLRQKMLCVRPLNKNRYRPDNKTSYKNLKEPLWKF